jgi:protein gp37
MAENSKIEWTDHTVNFWNGCTKVSPGCANCYAERRDAHYFPTVCKDERAPGEEAKPSHWGVNAARMLRVEAAANEAMRYERRAVKECRRFRVFTNSLADFFEDRRDLDAARATALESMFRTPHLDWIVLTKRPEEMLALLKRAERDTDSTGCSDWIRRWLGWGQERPTPPANVWLGTTVEDQERADVRIPALLRVPAAVRFLSCEPLLGPVDLGRVVIQDGDTLGDALYHQGRGAGLDWVICGGESGPGARPLHPSWARSLRDQCEVAGVPFMFKQWGEWAPMSYQDVQTSGHLASGYVAPDGGSLPSPGNGFCHGPRQLEEMGCACVARVGKKTAGRLLDGIEHLGYPTQAQV